MDIEVKEAGSSRTIQRDVATTFEQPPSLNSKQAPLPLNPLANASSLPTLEHPRETYIVEYLLPEQSAKRLLPIERSIQQHLSEWSECAKEVSGGVKAFLYDKFWKGPYQKAFLVGELTCNALVGITSQALDFSGMSPGENVLWSTLAGYPTFYIPYLLSLKYFKSQSGLATEHKNNSWLGTVMSIALIESSFWSFKPITQLLLATNKALPLPLGVASIVAHAAYTLGISPILDPIANWASKKLSPYLEKSTKIGVGTAVGS